MTPGEPDTPDDRTGSPRSDGDGAMAAGSAPSVLVVDDDGHQRQLLKRLLEAGGCDCELAESGAQARELLERRRYELALCDVRMPGEDGLVLIGDLRRIDPEMAVVMISGIDDPKVAEVALDRGAYGYLVKPFGRHELNIAVSNATHRRELELRNARHREQLEAEVEKRTAALNDLVSELRYAHRESVDRLARAVEARDAHTGRHIDRVGALTAKLGAWIGLERQVVEQLRLAAPMHDLGKLGIPDRILQKPGPLSPEERVEIERHTVIGYDLLKGSLSELLELAASIALTHHERFEGGGYPQGLVGEQIPIEGRTTALADVLDALVSDRVYRPALPFEEAVAVVEEGRGSHFDPVLVDALLSHLPEVIEVLEIDREGERKLN